MENVKLQTTPPAPGSSFRAEDYLEASEKTLNTLHREKLLAISTLVDASEPERGFETRGDIVAAILATRTEAN